MAANGWQHYFNDATTPSGATYSPHYGAQPAAYFLVAGDATGLYIGIADGTSIARVWTRRYSK